MPPVLPRLPRGFADRGPDEIAATARMMEAIRRVYELYGFEAVETPFVEYTETLGKFLPDLDRPNEGVFSFQDDDEQWLSLRYDLTAPLARYVAEHFDRLPKPYRSYRAGPVFRNEKPGPGRFRQFWQFDADTVGAATVAADAEICMMAADTLEALGVKRGDYVIKVNDRKILDGVMEAIGLSGADQAGRRLTVLRAIDKLDRLGVDAVRALLQKGRRDESGDVTKGADLTDEQAGAVLAVVQAKGLGELRSVLDQISMNTGGVRDEAGGLGHLLYDDAVNRMVEEFSPLLEGAGYGTDRIRFDPTVVRGLEYYTGPVFEAELTFEVRDDKDRPVRFGSVGGGGRYDGLVGRFRPEPVPATGFSIGVSRLFAALKVIDSPLVKGTASAGPVVVLVLDRDQTAHYTTIVASLRQAGIRAEMYLGAAGMNAQLKYADRRGARCAVIQGSNERSAEGGPTVLIRDLVLGAELAQSSKDRADYLTLRQRAQFPCPEADLVAQVREVLARHPN